jgi:hypothetical protein
LPAVPFKRGLLAAGRRFIIAPPVDPDGRRRGAPLRSFISLLIVITGLIAGLGLAACTPESRRGLPEDFRIAPDARFVGAWRGGNEAGALQGSEVTARLTVDPAEPLDLLLAGEENWRSTRGAHRRDVKGVLRFYDIAGRRVVAIQRRDGTADEQTWRFASYRFGGDDSLVLYFMDEPRLYILLRNGALHGKIRGGEREFPDLLITAEPDKIAALIRTSDPATLFTARLGPLQRIKS